MWFRKRSKGDPLKLEEVFEGYEIPVFDALVHDVLRAVRDDESSNSDIARGLAVDPGVSVRVLRLVNSAGFGLRQPVDDLSQAVQLVGRSSLESLLISLAVRDALPAKSVPGFSPRSFWRCAAQRAAVAGRLSVDRSPADRSLAWTAALLQDLALPLLVDHFGQRYCELLRAWTEGHEPLEALEQETLGVDHAELGRRICERWGFPERLTETIAAHHEEPTPETAPTRLVARLRPDPSSEGDIRGVGDFVAAGDAVGLSAEDCDRALAQGLEDAAPLIALLS